MGEHLKLKSPNAKIESKVSTHSAKGVLSPLSYTTSDRKEEPKKGNLSEALSEQRQVLRQPHVTDQFVDEG